MQAHLCLGGCRFEERIHASLKERGQALHVVAGSHHRHRHRGARLPDRAHELAAHVPDAGKRMFDPGTLAGNALVAPLLALAQGLARLGPALHRVHEAQHLQHLPTLPARIGLVRVHAAPGVVHVQHLVEVVSVVLAGRARGDAADEAVLEMGQVRAPGA